MAHYIQLYYYIHIVCVCRVHYDPHLTLCVCPLTCVYVPSAHRVQPVALSNSFFGSACREWQDHLSLGLHSNTGGRGPRVEKKPRIHDNASWKDKFFESDWGERYVLVM